MTERTDLPIRVVVTDDLARSRVTVFFRLILAIPHLIVLLFWGIAALLAAVVLWFGFVIAGKGQRGAQEFVATYVRYATQVSAYLYLAANPYPTFGGALGYPVDLEIDLAAHQSRGRVAARLVLAVPAMLLVAVLGGGLTVTNWSGITAGSSGAEWWSSTWTLGGIASSAAFLAWFAALARSRMPRGLRDLLSYCIGYTAHATGYLMLLTDRYPTTDPGRVTPFLELPAHPIRLDLTDDVRRSRLTVFFRFPLAVPHLIWLGLWTLIVLLVAGPIWIVSLVIGRLPAPFHRFFAAWTRYSTHVVAFLYVIGGPFPGFTGAAGRYPVDISIDPPERQRRLTIAVRGLLAMPALILSGTLGSAALLVGLLGWWAALVTGRMPEGLRNLGAVCLRYSAQASAYVFLVTEKYPYSAPALRDRPHDLQLDLLHVAPPGGLTASEAL